MNKREFFDGVAAGDDRLLFTDADRAKIAELRGRLGRLTGLRVLEPGCGAGPLTEYLADWVGAAGRVFAFDESPGMANECRRRLAGRETVHVACAAAETIELADAAWDRVLLFRVFPHFDDKGLVLDRMRACLAPRGRLVIAHLEGSARLNALHAGFSEPVRHDRMPDLAATTELLRAHGFRVDPGIDTDEAFFVSATPVLASAE